MAANSNSLSGLARRLVVDELIEEDVAKEASEQAQKDRIPFVKHLVDSKLVSAIDIAAQALRGYSGWAGETSTKDAGPRRHSG